jgi:hypothetical protein
MNVPVLETARRLLDGDTTIFLSEEGEPDMGYLVGRRTYNLRIGRSIADSMSAFPLVRAWLETVQHVVNSDNTIGSWTDADTGDFHLDVCDVFDNLFVAREHAAKRGELAIWDIEEAREIRTHEPERIPFGSR